MISATQRASSSSTRFACACWAAATGAEGPWTADADGVTLAIRVTPRASRTEIIGIQPQADGRLALAVRVASPPVDGAANEVLVAFLAKQLAVAKSAITLRSGATGRVKVVRIAGDGAMLAERLALFTIRPPSDGGLQN
jgi:uncharacterized protein (TIGR00251 family)